MVIAVAMLALHSVPAVAQTYTISAEI
jgi:hypothetical protein